MKPRSQPLTDRAELDAQRAACRTVSFTVRAPRLLRLQPGVRSPELVHLLKARSAPTAVLVCAAQAPGSRPSAARNKSLHKALAAAIQQLRLESFPAERHATQDEDASDPAYLVFGISGAQAEALLVEFGQDALLWCNQAGPPELMLHPSLRRSGRDFAAG
ncbi:DUF3293 domain-containing protein [Oxalobacteraceae bacterium OM1]|nr:DUF3293 domain-containing protein [Oxalobacteraceae bacterium OM1]